MKKVWSTGYLEMLICKKQKNGRNFIGVPRFEPAAFPITVLMYDLSLKQKKSLSKI